jgi:Rap1a immunity proteins
MLGVEVRFKACLPARVKGLLLVVLAMAALDSSAQAEVRDGYNLDVQRDGYLAIERGEVNVINLVEDSYFVGYILGVTDTMLDEIDLCVPPSTTVREIAAIVSEYMDRHKPEWTNSAESIVREAVKTAFICK